MFYLCGVYLFRYKLHLKNIIFYSYIGHAMNQTKIFSIAVKVITQIEVENKAFADMRTNLS